MRQISPRALKCARNRFKRSKSRFISMGSKFLCIHIYIYMNMYIKNSKEILANIGFQVLEFSKSEATIRQISPRALKCARNRLKRSKSHIISMGSKFTCIYWSIGVLEHWSIGVLEYWSIGVLEHWDIRLLDYQTIRLLDYQTIRLLDYQTIRLGSAEWRRSQ